MRTLSFWARCHAWQARAVIVSAHLLLAVLAFFIGHRLQHRRIDLPALLFYGSIAAFIITAYAYPSKNKTGTKAFKARQYRLRKTADVIIACCSFVLMCFLANHYGNTFAHVQSAYSSVSSIPKPTAQQILASLQYRDKKTLTRDEKRILKKEFKRQLVVYAKAKVTGDNKKGEEAAVIILAIIAACGLLALLGALACEISCNGSEAAAIILLLVGTAGLVWLTIVVVKGIQRSYKKKRAAQQVKP